MSSFLFKCTLKREPCQKKPKLVPNMKTFWHSSRFNPLQVFSFSSCGNLVAWWIVLKCQGEPQGNTFQFISAATLLSGKEPSSVKNLNWKRPSRRLHRRWSETNSHSNSNNFFKASLLGEITREIAVVTWREHVCYLMQKWPSIDYHIKGLLSSTDT